MATNSLAKQLHYSYYGAVVRDSTFIGDFLAPRSVRESTSVHLQDPHSGEEVLLIGTLNLSNFLAHRTKKLLDAFAPEALLVQASEPFVKASEFPATSSEEFSLILKESGYLKYLNSSTRLPFSFNSLVYAYKRFCMKGLLLNMMRVPSDYTTLFTPGLEVKFALEIAQKFKAQVYLAGEEFDRSTIEILAQEKEINTFKTLFTYAFTLCDSWQVEAHDLHKLLRFHTLKDLSESYFNKDQIAWIVRFAEKLVPAQKKLLIDKRSESFLYAVEKKLPGKKKAVLVNQWHMESFERLWRALHGVEIKRPATSGTEDMPLEEIQHYIRSNDIDRAIIEARTKSEMMSSSRALTTYLDENRSHIA